MRKGPLAIGNNTHNHRSLLSPFPTTKVARIKKPHIEKPIVSSRRLLTLGMILTKAKGKKDVPVVITIKIRKMILFIATA
jgi:hypothetical protein